MNWRVIQFGGCLFFNLARDLAKSVLPFRFFPFSHLTAQSVRCLARMSNALSREGLLLVTIADGAKMNGPFPTHREQNAVTL